MVVKKVMPYGNYEVYQKLCQIESKHLAKILDCFTADNHCVVIEQYINGKRLDAMMYEQSLSDEDVLHIMTGLCEVLSVVHAKGIIHRDIQPRNIVIAEGNVILLDFDIARTKKENMEKDTRLLGTAGYASPEQFGFAQTDERSDIYSLGIVLEEMLANRANGNKTFLNDVANKCTQIDPNLRYQNADELLREIRGKRTKKNSNWGMLAYCEKRYIPIYIIVIIIYLFVTSAIVAAGLDMTKGIAFKIIAMYLNLMSVLLPTLYLLNIGRVADKLIPANFKHKWVKILVRVLVAITIFMLVMLLEAIILPS